MNPNIPKKLRHMPWRNFRRPRTRFNSKEGERERKRKAWERRHEKRGNPGYIGTSVQTPTRDFGGYMKTHRELSHCIVCYHPFTTGYVGQAYQGITLKYTPEDRVQLVLGHERKLAFICDKPCCEEGYRTRFGSPGSEFSPMISGPIRYVVSKLWEKEEGKIVPLKGPEKFYPQKLKLSDITGTTARNREDERGQTRRYESTRKPRPPTPRTNPFLSQDSATIDRLLSAVMPRRRREL